VRIADAQLFRYRLPLREPLAVGDHTLTARRGLLLRVQGAGGAEGWGEAAPLPGFSRESLADAVAQARRLAAELPGTDQPEAGLDALLRGLPGADLPPSVRFAAESAVVELWAARRETTVGDVLGGGAETIALNALITDDGSDLEAEAEGARVVGYRAVKLKVGRRSVEADVHRVRTLHRVLGAEVGLRLDANRAWTVEEATAFADALGDLPLSYVEEPLRDPTRLPELVDATGLPVALDETTREEEPGPLPDALPLRAVVLKPTLLGGLTAAQRWAQWARERGAVPVVSASYESGGGLRMLAVLAATLSEAPAGLSTYACLAADVLTPRLPLDGARVSVADLYAPTVDRSALAPVESTD
jgi:o-succinylbenzoate synthase